MDPESLVYLLFLLLPLVTGGLLLWFARRRRASGRRASPGQLLLGNALVFLFLSSLLLLGGETYFRFMYDESDSTGFTRTSDRWFRRYFVYNSFGVRDNIEYFRKIKPDKRRITFVGDSFTVGHGIASVEDRFANIIRAAHPEWEVHTLAKIGLDTADESDLLRRAIAEGYQADQVVLVYCLNDVSDLFPEWKHKVEEIQARANQRGWLWRHSYLFDTLYCRWIVSRDPYLNRYFAFVTDGYRGPVWEQQQQRLAEFRSLVQNGGGRLLVVIFPFFNRLGPDYEFRFAHEQLDRFWDDQGIPCLDLLSIYSNLPPAKLTVNRYDAHPNEYAHHLAAQRIDAFLTLQLAAASNAPAVRSTGRNSR